MSSHKAYYYVSLLFLCPLFLQGMEDKKSPSKTIHLKKWQSKTPEQTLPTTTITYPPIQLLLSGYNRQQRLVYHDLLENKRAMEYAFLEEQLSLQKRKIVLLEKELREVNRDINNTFNVLEEKKAGK